MRLSVVIVAALGLDCARAPRSSEPVEDRAEPDAVEVDDSPTAAETSLAPDDGDPPTAKSPGTRYASLAADACAAELATREIAFEALAPRLGITSPVRLRGALSGVSFRTLWPEAERARTSFEIYDCRLVLALDDFAPLLRAHGVVEVMLFSAYRPPPAGWSESIGLRHEGGLAIDIGYFRKADGTALNVATDFAPHQGERICAPGAPAKDATPKSIELRKIACDGAAAGLFHVTLTPAYDRVHRDHFHLELTPGKTDFVAR